MRPLGLFLVALSALFPIYWYAGIAAERDPVALFSQYLGSASLILMGLNQFIATRAPGLETVFGGLDRIYVLHKWIAVVAIACLGLHDVIDAEMNGLRVGPLSGIAEDIGEISLYGLLILGFASVITFIPYHLWKWTHRFIGIFFAMGAFHYFFIEKPFSNMDPLGLYVSAFCVLGMVSYVYLALVRPWLPGGHGYTVSAVRNEGGVTDVELTPRGRGMRHKAGQFAFVRFNGEGLGEEHPFTLSSAPNDERSLRFSIKDLGDFTSRLGKELTSGIEATVTGPYGHFKMPSGRAPQVWVGAGIGITPFLAFAGSLKDRETGPVTLYYCVREHGAVLFSDELAAAAKDNDNLRIVILNSAAGERLNADRIAEDLGTGIGEAHLFFCGPKAMRRDLKEKLALKGLKASRFHFEEFEMRSGIGLRKLAGWLVDGGFYIYAKWRSRKVQPAQ